MNYKTLVLALGSSLCILAAPAQDPGNTRAASITGTPTPIPSINTAAFPTGSGTAKGGIIAMNGSCTVTATPNVALKDVFVQWTINGTAVSTKNPYTFTPNVIETVVANFGYDITVTSSPAAGGTNSGAGTYVIGQSVTLVATPNDCYNFLGWTKSGSKTYLSTTPTYIFTPTNSEALVANYQLKEDVITTASNPVGAGTSTGGGTKSCDSPVTVTAKPAAGYKFNGWTANGIVVSIKNPYPFKADGAEVLTANFVDDSTPTLVITSPKASETVSSPFLTITGTANNVLGVSSVVLTIGGVPATVTSGDNWSNWTASVTLSPGHNVIDAYALSENNNPSLTKTITVTYSSAGNAPASIAGLIFQVDQGTNSPFDVSFDSATFEQVSASTNQGSSVGNYTYTQTTANTATLVLAGFAPPNQAGQGPSTISLTFTSPIAANFIDQSGHTGTLSLSPGSSEDFSSVSGWTIVQSSGAASPTNVTVFGDDIYTNIDGSGNTNYGTYTSMQYGPMATMVVLTNLSLNSGIETNYLMFLWTSADAGTIYETLFDSAGDPPTYASNPFTATFQPSGVKYIAPASLNGLTLAVTQKTPQAESPFDVYFGQATEAQSSSSANNKPRVSNYVYTRTGPTNAILNTFAFLPPTGGGGGGGAIYLTFTNSTTASYINPSDPSSGSVAVSVEPATGYFAPTSLTQATITVHFPGGTHAATFNNGNFAITGSSKGGTDTFSAYSPTVAMLIFNFTDPSDAGGIEYIQLQFTSATGGSIDETETDGTIETGTFTISK